MLNIIELMEKNHQQEYLVIKNYVKTKILNHISINIPEFTIHGELHSQHVLEYISTIIENYQLNNILTSLDIFGLTASAWLHDVGLIQSTYDGKQLNKNDIRKLHNVLSSNFIIENYSKVGISSINVARFIANICKNHKRIEIIEENLEKEGVLSGFNIHPQMDAAIFRLADAMDVDNRRAPTILRDEFLKLSGESYKHWKACELTDGITVKEGKLMLNGSFSSNEDENIISWKICELFDELWRVQDIFSEYQCPLTNVIGTFTDINTDEKKIYNGRDLFRQFSLNYPENIFGRDNIHVAFINRYLNG